MFLHLSNLIRAEFGLVLELSVVRVHGHIDHQRLLLRIDAILDLCVVAQYLATMDDFQIVDIDVLLSSHSCLLVVQVKYLVFELANGSSEKAHSHALQLVLWHALLAQNVTVVF